MKGVKLIIDGAAMDALLRGDQGPVTNHLIRTGDKVIAGARAILAPHNKTTRLSRSIVKRFSQGDNGPTLTIVAGAGLGDPNYAYWVHEGNGPQGGRIYPKTKKALAWVNDGGTRPSTPAEWRAAVQSGRAVVARSVAVSKPIRYLTEPLAAVLGEEEI